MSYVLMSSGGKDSTLALDRARRQHLDVRRLVNIYDAASDRVAFHGVRATLIAAQAAACGLEPIQASTDPDHPYEAVFLATLDDLAAHGASGVVFGNIHLADVREWFETRVRDAGLDHVEPLWGDPPRDLLREFVDRGFQAVVVSVDLQQGAAELLGRAIDREFVTDVHHIEGLDPCGERGEYHSFVYGGPTFARPLAVTPGVIRTEKNHRLLDLSLEP